MKNTLSLLGLLMIACHHPSPLPPPSTAVEPTPVQLAYPDAPRGDVVDDYFGTKVADPYRWLEDPDAPASRAWIDAQNALTHGWIDAVPQRAAIRARLEALWNYERFSAPTKRGNRYFYQRNDGLQNQAVLYWTETITGTPKVLLDPNTLSKDGTVALAGLTITDDGMRLAYGIADGGSDWSTWYVRDVDSGQDLPDKLEWVKFSEATWTKDGKGFFYGRYPTPKDALEDVNQDQKLYHHVVGTPQSADTLVFEAPENPKWMFSPVISDDGRWLVIHVSESTEDKNRVYYKDLSKPRSRVLPLIPEYDASYVFLGNEGPVFWFQTNLDAPRKRVIAVDTRGPARDAWKELLPQAADTLDGCSVVGGRFVTTWLHDAHSVVRLFDLKGAPMGEVELPGLGSAGGFGGRQDDPETFFTFTSYATPTSIFRLDVTKPTPEPWKTPKVSFDPSAYVTEQVFYTSADGTRIPMFLTHRKDVTPDGQRPTLLYGYGGFNIPLTPGFNPSTLCWMEMGGVYAVANLRGGGEYGEEWHHAGTRERKQNVFDDFVAAARWLEGSGWTKPSRLGIFGGSNGGLLVGAVLEQQPELFGAAIPAVGVMDMLRYHRFTIGWAWASDYGTSEEAEMFPVLHRYSPVHNAKPGVSYPATLIVTADHDDRVVPAHSFKFAAALQAAQAGPAPILIRVETRAGHSAGKPTMMRIEEAADEWSFLVRALGMDGMAQ